MNKKYIKRTIVYVNFSPYENAGKILDFLLDNFHNVIVFVFIFHELGDKQDSNQLKVFKNGILEKTYTLHQIPVPISLIFFLLPIRSLIIFIQILWHTYRLRKQFNTYDIYFTVNAFTAWIGILLRKIGLVNKTVFWVWDYYPPTRSNVVIKIMRWIYWQFDKLSVSSDKLVFLNKRLEDLRKGNDMLPATAKYPIVPIGTNPAKTSKKNKGGNVILCFLGVLKKSQGLDLIFDNAKELLKTYPTLRLNVIGGGPDISYFKKRAVKTKIKAKFYGYVPDEKDIEKILNESTIGIAPYIPEESNASYYGDPSKIKIYFNFGLPVITTDVFVFSSEIKKKKAGVVIDYYQTGALLKSIGEITANYRDYKKNALLLAEKYYFKKIYPELFRI